MQLLPAVPALPRQRDGGHPAEGDAPRAVGRPAAIENVTYRHLLSLRGGIKDYYYDSTQWLYRTVMGSTRDVEPLEFLVHQDHSFL